MKRVMHVLPGLAVGGTEMVLLRLVGSTSGIKHRVVTLTVHDALRPEFEQLGVQVYTLGMSRNPFSWIRVFKLRKIIREFAPDILQSWLYAADLALMFSGVGRSTRKIWNIRQSETGLIRGQLHIYLMQRLAALLSRVVPDQIVYCGAVAKFLHQGIGYGSTAAAVIPNGIDVARYKPDVLARKSVREELGLGEGVFVFGMVGRYDPLKNQQLLLNAYALLAPQTEHVSLIMAGTNVDGDNPEIT
ncbi:MAG: glycosyltransferase, partial [Proteobacteria bacterium]|nr:glycosyltransferase [Pseudomonadota bacterium]